MMDSGKLNDWLQVIGLFGVLGGLVFVGLQVRQDRLIASAEGVYGSVGFFQDWAGAMGGGAEVWVKGSAGETLSEVEAVQFDALADARLLFRYSLWNRENLIGNPETAQAMVQGAAFEFANSPGLLDFWNRRSTVLRAGPYQAYVTAVHSELERLGAAPSE